MNTVVRDLEADLAICEAATPGPYTIEPCGCGHSACNFVFIHKINYSDGRLLPEDARFIAEARAGWPYTIRRALAAEAELLRVNVENRNLEAEVDRLRNEINILQEQLEQRRCSA
ncbi:hypothetical protein [Brevibacillus thermoruber]|uniref:hypothetical protein n=1 Tax=Brevibacillus thermoruber TaxID=33942 RepID=UPI0005523EB8|nr:hypothetical protein [Brevibacillus thermoruber]